MADAWFQAAECRNALETYAATQARVAGEKRLVANLLLKRSGAEQKLGHLTKALRRVERAREALTR